MKQQEGLLKWSATNGQYFAQLRREARDPVKEQSPPVRRLLQEAVTKFITPLQSPEGRRDDGEPQKDFGQKEIHKMRNRIQQRKTAHRSIRRVMEVRTADARNRFEEWSQGVPDSDTRAFFRWYQRLLAILKELDEILSTSFGLDLSFLEGVVHELHRGTAVLAAQWSARGADAEDVRRKIVTSALVSVIHNAKRYRTAVPPDLRRLYDAWRWPNDPCLDHPNRTAPVSKQNDEHQPHDLRSRDQ
jgi:hypothetical protein